FGDTEGWNPFGGSVREVVRQSDSVMIDVSDPPVPDLPVGTFELTCSEPRVPRHGPAAIDLRLAGAANLRSVQAPDFAGNFSAGTELEALGTSIREREGSIVMQRGWRYLMFPESTGELRVPPLEFRFFDPRTDRAETARCGGWIVPVSSVTSLGPEVEPTAPRSGAPAERSVASSYWIPATVATFVLALLVPMLFLKVRRERAAKSLLDLADDPRELRFRLEAWLVRHGYHPARLRSQRSEIGEAWRGVSSLLDLVEREPWELERSRSELRRRVRDLIEEVTGR
ncbi:MAG: hypothetical protein R3338_06680, partial [Thermoanaerobaculia bacterium]|nr:hypothetical protein [Thermoanaerobaculia bacterium]